MTAAAPEAAFRFTTSHYDAYWRSFLAPVVCVAGQLQLTMPDSPVSFAGMELGDNAVVHDNPLGAAMRDNPLGLSSMLSSPASSPGASPRPARLLLPGGSAELPSSPLVSLATAQLLRLPCTTQSPITLAGKT